jgi:hypothetical protein
MRLSRLRSGEIVAGLGAIALLVALSLAWFGAEPTVYAPVDEIPAGFRGLLHQSGWSGLGWLALVPLVVTIALALALVVATAAERTPALPLAIGVLTVPSALLAVLVILARLIDQPGLGVNAPDSFVEVRWPAYLGLAGALAVLAGAWRAIGDERTDTAEARAQTERALGVRGAPRPVPPRRDKPS